MRSPCWAAPTNLLVSQTPPSPCTNAISPGMVRVPPTRLYTGLPNIWQPGVDGPEYFIDKYEVTNARFKEFVDAGGYANRSYWKEEFVRDGDVVPWEKALVEFRDATGRPGPSSWRDGNYPEGKENHPVSGVSWYEAAAFAEFADRSLPTLYHWTPAGGSPRRLSGVLVPLSNLEGSGTAPVGAYQGIGQREVYDVAGNVREWCWNATDDSGDRRYSLGGSWSDSSYMSTAPKALSPWDRSPQNGFRSAYYPFGKATVPDTFFRPIPLATRQNRQRQRLDNPISDESFKELVARVFSFERRELNAVVDSVEDSPLWRRETISFDADYDDDRVTAILFLPKGVEPPYQTVVWGPLARGNRPSSTVGRGQGFFWWEFLVLGGRAVMYPVYWGTLDRRPGPGLPPLPPWGTVSPAYRDVEVRRVQDFIRSVDYLQTRADVDQERLGYYGVSLGALNGILMLGVDDRIRVGAFILGSYQFWYSVPYPEVEMKNFVPRIDIPILSINGEHDYRYYEEARVSPLVDLLGTPKEHQRHMRFPGGHGMYGVFHHQARTHITEWFDRYFGPPVKGVDTEGR